MKTILNEFQTLNNGISKPKLGFGTANLGNRNTTIDALRYAVSAGYRHFDSASMYNNEKELGEVIADSGIDRKEFFIATKLWNSDHGFNNTKVAFHKSLKILKMDYVDLYMTHWPVPKLRLESWRAMEELLDEDKVRTIGVSNYTIRHLEEHFDNFSIAPAINQVEFNPFLFQKDLNKYCKSKNIILEAYSPLAVGKKLSDDSVLKIANKYDKSAAQIFIKWSLQLGNSVIPRSKSKEHIIENTLVFDFDLNDEDMKTLSSLNEDYRLEWDPTDEP